MSEKLLQLTQSQLDALIKAHEDAALLRGYVEGLRAFAWWKDGVQYVGTCGTTLKKAIEKAEAEFAPRVDD